MSIVVNLPSPSSAYDAANEAQTRHEIERYFLQVSTQAVATSDIAYSLTGTSLYAGTVFNAPLSAQPLVETVTGTTGNLTPPPTYAVIVASPFNSVLVASTPAPARTGFNGQGSLTWTSSMSPAPGTPGQSLIYGKTDFTIEGWFMTSNPSQYMAMLTEAYIKPPKSNNQYGSTFLVAINNTANGGQVVLYTTNGLMCATTIGGLKFNDGVRHHVRVCRSRTSYYIFIDGILRGYTLYTSYDSYVQPPISVLGPVISITAGNDVLNAGRGWVGTLDNWRVLRVCLSRFNFKVPTPPFPTA
jgi:hypothetical protein